MSNLTYTELLNNTLEIYSESTLEAYHYIMTNKDSVFGGNRAQIYNFAYACAAASGLEKEAMDLLREAIIDNGFWYSHEYLLSDDDLKALHTYDEFHEMVTLCKEREEAAHAAEKPELKVITSETSNEKAPLFIALHGDQENNKIAEPYWKSVVSHGYTLALPQSSQIQFSEAFEWDDVEKGSDELKEHFDKLLNEQNIDQQNILIGGFSAGARVALQAILHEKVAVKGFVFMAPWLPETEEYEGLLHVLKEKDIKGFIVCGEEDGDCYDCSKQFAELLSHNDIPHAFITVAGLDHDYPEGFEDILGEALQNL